ncbi:hypothetical protein LTR84_006899 [Exophiala bonariae]|uniref:Uncharacterized protein n=1 Tax=Exophiala bonariae TaxID=1690606 RepID=A0AAV9N0G2_9EURO|nr:hypothetical protein LTR84_006899 [Exophiala bonariae]
MTRMGKDNTVLNDTMHEDGKGRLSSKVIENKLDHKHEFVARDTTVTLFPGDSYTIFWSPGLITSIQTSMATSKSVSVRTYTVSITKPTTVTAVPTSIKTVTAISGRVSVATQVVTSVERITLMSGIAKESGYQSWEDQPPAAEETPFPPKISEASAYQSWEDAGPATNGETTPAGGLSFPTQFVTIVKTVTVTSENCVTGGYQSWADPLPGTEHATGPESPSAT